MSSTTNSLHRRKSRDMARDMGSENPYFFWPRNFPGRKIFAAKVKKSQKSWIESFPAGFFFGLKIEKSKKNPDESVYGHNFLEKKSEMLENFGNKQIPSRKPDRTAYTLSGFLVSCHPPYASPAPRGRGRMRCLGIICTGSDFDVQVIQHHRNRGDAHAAGAEACRSPQERLPKLKPSGFYSYPISDVKKYEDSMAFRLKYPSKTAGFRPRD